jgi:hypothetical protein
LNDIYTGSQQNFRLKTINIWDIIETAFSKLFSLELIVVLI